MNPLALSMLGLAPTPVSSHTPRPRIQSPTQLAIMEILKDERGHHTVELARTLKETPAAIKDALRRLRLKGFAVQVGIIRLGVTRVSVWVKK